MDAEFEAVVANFPPLQFDDPAAQRASFAELRASIEPPRLPPNLEVLVDRSVRSADGHQVEARVYLPADLSAHSPTLVWIHGGGYVVGTADEDDSLCARIASELGIGVVSVDYRLAPEHPYPAGFEDCYAVVTALASAGESAQFDRLGDGNIVIGGGSAGAGLAAAVALRLRDEGLVFVTGQILLYPFIDSTLGFDSMRRYADGAIFNAHDAEVCWRHYLGAQRSAPAAYASPSATTNLVGLPPAYVAAAGADCLHDEAIDYALRMIRAGVSVELHSFPDVPHGFTGVAPRTSASKRALSDLLEAVRRFGGLREAAPKPVLVAVSEE
ncbi:alpha/beta hydrolase [Rhodococcus sp. T2V]|uniref:alpha/beta hydrolase n=1 Tax=Rhodococcus sp. T2V TaxID=3034164 RepID=UPI0023E2ABC8|nr:alpha/beta hydrolase [Rhodococcus sp. T2V]MDF3308202.1 alpha/beta hydrolase [Rhodococcus sp. T2V]